MVLFQERQLGIHTSWAASGGSLKVAVREGRVPQMLSMLSWVGRICNC